MKKIFNNVIDCLEKNKFYFSICVSFIVLIVFYFPAASIDISYFHNDDFKLISRLSAINNASSFFSYIFNFEYFKFRPVANFQYFLEYSICKYWYNGFVLYNIFMLLVLSILFTRIFQKCLTVFFFTSAALVLVTSKFVLYSLWNITGSFEMLAAIFFISILGLWFNGSEKTSKSSVVFLSVMLLLTSERYFPFVVLLPLFSTYMNSNRGVLHTFLLSSKCSLVIVAVYFGFRYVAGVPLIVGTQTDSVSESFNLATFVLHFGKSFVEVFGFSFGPRYLTGFEFADWVPINALYNNSIYIYGFFNFIYNTDINLSTFFFSNFS